MHESLSLVLCFKCIITWNAAPSPRIEVRVIERERERESVWWNALCDDSLCCSRQNGPFAIFFLCPLFPRSAAGTAKNERAKYRSYESIRIFFYCAYHRHTTRWRLGLCARRYQSQLDAFPIAETSSRYDHNHESIALYFSECLTSIISVNISDIRWARLVGASTRTMRSKVLAAQAA